jgi:acyl carrier protein
MNLLRHIFSSVLGIEAGQVTPELSLDSAPAWDSLNAIILVAEIEKAFDVRFEYEEAMDVKNVADVMKLIRAKGKDPGA